MEKKRIKVQGEESYFLGINEENERVYLRLPSFDCGHYWGCGYISIYRGTVNTENNYSTHTHFKGHIIGQQRKYDHEKNCFINAEYTHHLNEVLKETVLSDEESWSLSELINTMELLKKMAGFYNRGGMHTAQNPLKDVLKSDSRYKEICEVLLPQVFNEIDKILKDKKSKELSTDFFKAQVTYK